LGTGHPGRMVIGGSGYSGGIRVDDGGEDDKQRLGHILADILDGRGTGWSQSDQPLHQ